MRQLAARGWRVSLYALVDRITPSSNHRIHLEEFCEDVRFGVGETSRASQFGRLFRSLVRREAFQRQYFPAGPALTGLRTLLASERFDVVIFSRLYAYDWVPDELHPISVLDSQNVEERRLRAMVQNGRVTPRSVFARLQLGPVANFEREAVTRVGMTLAVSPQEFQHFERLAPGRVRLVPNGVNTRELTQRQTFPQEPRILFVGSLDYSANVDAVRYLATAILPHLTRRDVRVTVIGTNPSRAVYAAARRSPVRMDVLGYVEDLRPYIETSRCLIVPLRHGGGTRLKILEALSQGLPVLSTRLGCEGLELTHGDEVVVADDPEGFAHSIDRICADDDLCARLSLFGRKKVENRYDWSMIGSGLHAALLEVASARRVDTPFSLTDWR
jgi:glycosyltransferase involved in cell wall biosynthesis